MQSGDIDPVKFVAAGLVAGRLSDMQITQALHLRAQVFRGGNDDWDRHDSTAWHFGVWATDTPTQLLCTFRVFYHDTAHDTARGLTNGYAGVRYDLTNLSHHMGRVLELGRFCICPKAQNPDILRMAWAVLTRLVDRFGVDMLIGLSSFSGLNPAGPALSALVARNPAPSDMAPLPRAGQVNVALTAPPPNDPLRPGDLPPLVRTYLSMNAWFSGHYVVDHDLNTHNLFTCVEIAKVPATRARLLRRAAGLVAPV